MLSARLRATVAGTVILVSLLLVGGPTRAAGPSSSSGQATPYELHAILSLTGSAAFLGGKEAEAMHIVEAEVNRTGGIRGRPLKLVIEDDQTNPQLSVQLADRLIAQKAPIFVGTTHGAGCTAQEPLVVKDGPVQYCLSPTIPLQPGGFSFATNYASVDLIGVMVRYMRERGFTKIGMLTGTDVSGQDGDRQLNIAMHAPENARLTLVADEHWNLSDLTVVAQLTRIKAAGAQALLAWTTGTPLATVLRGYQDTGLDIPVFTTGGNMVYAQLESYKTFLPRELLFPGPPVFARDALTDRGIRSAIDAFFGDFKAAGIKPDQIHAFTWDVMHLVIDVLKRQGPDADADHVRAGIAAVRGWSGVLGKYDFQAVPQRGLGPTWLTVLRWDPDKLTWVAASKPGGGLLTR